MADRDKERRLVELLQGYSSAIVAFSGGVDSSYLAFMAHRVLGAQVQAVTAISPSVSELQREMAIEFARTYGLNHQVIHTREMENPEYTGNSSQRCFFCKSELYQHLERLRLETGAEVIFDGSNRDDLGDFRPGRQAADESGVVSPLVVVQMTKAEIRSCSKRWQLPTWDKPAMPCLSSRFPYGTAITAPALRQVDRAETFLRQFGLRNFRVRHHERLARIEVDRAEMGRLLSLDLWERIHRELRGLGYLYVTLDLGGFRSGSLNEVLQIETD